MKQDQLPWLGKVPYPPSMATAPPPSRSLRAPQARPGTASLPSGATQGEEEGAERWLARGRSRPLCHFLGTLVACSTEGS